MNSNYLNQGEKEGRTERSILGVGKNVVARRKSTRMPWLVAGLLAGVCGTYFLDPVSGRRRRSIFVDRTNRLKNDLFWYLGKEGKDISNRTRGFAHNFKNRIFSREKHVDDSVLVDRVRAELGRRTTHPGAIQVECLNGAVTLTGLILSTEVQSLVKSIESVRGVKRLINHLEVHQQAEHIPGLQGSGSFPTHSAPTQKM